MRRTVSPSSRPLSQHENKIFQSTELRGRLSKRALQICSTIEKWENVMTKGALAKNEPKIMRSLKRCKEYNQAKRTLHPELNNEQEKVQSKKILVVEDKLKNPGTWGSLLNKTASVQELNRPGIKVFKEKSPENPFDRVNETRFQNHINVLPCTTFQEEKPPAMSSPTCTRRKLLGNPSPSPNSSFFVDPSLLGTEEQRRRTAEKKQRARHLSSSILFEPLQQPLVPNKRYHNKESEQPSIDELRLNHLTKGKRLFSTDLQKETTVVEIEPLNPLSKGKKIYHASASVNNSMDMSCEEVVSGRRRSIFSYRTFASQVPL